MANPQAIRRPRWMLPLIQAARRANPAPSITGRDVASFLACSAFWVVFVYGAARWAAH